MTTSCKAGEAVSRPDNIPVAQLTELGESAIKPVWVDGVELAIVRHEDCVSAFVNRCPHQATRLSEATVTGGILTCPAHGWQFACDSGRRIDGKTPGLTRFNVLVENTEVKIDRNELSRYKAQSCNADPPQTMQPIRSITHLPGPKGLPLVGSALSLVPGTVHLTLEQWCRKFGPVYKFRLFRHRCLVISDPRLIGKILRDRPEGFRRWSIVETIAREMGVNGLLFAEGESWRRQRQLVAQGLRPEQIREFFPRLRLLTEDLKDIWQGWASDSKPIDIQKDLMRYTTNVIMEFAFGSALDGIEGMHAKETIQRDLSIIFPMIDRRAWSPFPYWRYFRLPCDKVLDRALTSIHALARKLIAQSRARIAQQTTENFRPRDLLEALLTDRSTAGSALSDDEIVANIATTLLAGEDTSANTIAWAAYFMCHRPDVQKKMQREVDSVLGQNAVLNDLNEGKRLTYLDAIINETLRLKSVVPLMAFEPNFDIQVGDLLIPARTIILVLTRDAGLSSETRSPVDQFNPDRWLAGESAASMRGSGDIPFGTGPRVCPGRSVAWAEIRSVLAMVCRNFDILPVDGAEDVEEVSTVAMRPKNLRVVLARRR